MISNVNSITAFLYGLLSFFSPCILPLLPLYLSYLAGSTLEELKEKRYRGRMIVNALAFVTGLSLLNVLLGFGANSISGLLRSYSDYMRYFGGVLMIIFGLFFLNIINPDFLNREKKIELKWLKPNPVSAFLMGITFSFGWTPCNGPIVASIIMLASFQKDYLQAGGLMLIYSAGFAIPFLIAAMMVSQLLSQFKKIYKYFDWIKKVSGVLMIVMGILLIINKLAILNI